MFDLRLIVRVVVGAFLGLFNGILVSENLFFVDGGDDALLVDVGPKGNTELVDVTLAGGEVVLVE